jgi:Arc/MetJ-type ribon-helix-helix transcriptional regulator
MAVVRRHKKQLNTTVSPLAQHQVKQLTESGMFASESDCVQTAISMLFFCTQIDAFAEASAKFGLSGMTV